LHSTTKVKVSFPLDEKTITVERDVEEDENVTAAVIRLLSEIAILSKTKEEAQTLEQAMTEEPIKAEQVVKSAKWIYPTRQPRVKFAERYAKLME